MTSTNLFGLHFLAGKSKSSGLVPARFLTGGRFCSPAIFACFVFFLCYAVVVPGVHGQEDERPLLFNRDVRNLLTDRCLPCHGPDEATLAAGLRLDVRENAVDEMGVIVPGESDASEVWRRILSDDPSEVMPPPELHKPLTEAEKAIFKRWIDEGAVYEPHWAYVPPRWPVELGASEPAAREAGAARENGVDQGDPAASSGDAAAAQSPRGLAAVIDTLIERRLREEQADPTALADRTTLIRRLTLDLTGLPPTLTEVDAFVADESPDAYERLVERLLASPRYGERMAVYWLDLVRYADTVGYHGDQNVSQSPYRDYVIGAFNRNLSYDQFIREQLAGDLLDDPSLEQLVASGYNRLNQTTEEGGSQAKEYLAIYFADRVRNASQVFMGSTLGCAQCHDHKYDPLSAKDFYAFGAFFADIEEVGVYGNRGRPPMIRVPSAAIQAELTRLDSRREEISARLDRVRESLRDGQSAWEAEMLGRLEQVTEQEVDWLDESSGIVASDKRDSAWQYTAAEQGPVRGGTRSRRQVSEGLVQHLFLGVETGAVVTADTRFYAWVYLDPEQPPQAVMLQFNDGNWEHRKVWGNDAIAYGRRPESHAAYQRSGDLPPAGLWVRLEATAAEVGLAPGAKIAGMAFTQFGGVAYWSGAGLLSSDAVPATIAAALQKPVADRTAEEVAAVTDYYLGRAPAVVELQAESSALAASRQAVYESAPEMVISKSVAPRTIRLLPRGNWMDDSGPVVEPAIPEMFGSLDVEGRPTRLDLANWLCQPDHPLTSRTMVNRLWSLLFGRGVCSSLDDFGGQGTYPSQPELLDALAIEFVRSGWDVKHLLRGIVLSQAYRRAARVSSDLQRRDPYNDWFARQQSFGLLAESVRDSALAISGLLVEEVGGRSVHPYQPAGYYAQLNFPRREYQADMNANQYRRGVYTHWQRTFLHPMLKAFDAPSREECTAQRARSNTPLQALTLLNDPSFVEAARGFAARIVTEGGGDTAARLQWAYRTAVAHPASPEVLAALEDIYRAHRVEYEADPVAVGELLAVGLSPVPTDISAAELAAWTSVARVILNLHEVITRY